MTNNEFVAKLINIAKNMKTLYILGCFGAPMNPSNKKRYTNNNSYNREADRTAMINAASPDTFGFDCVCLIKGVLWGFSGDTTKKYGGAIFTSNGVPDIGADSMIKVCKDVSTDFSKIEVGEAVWMKGHIGVYIGDGLAVECTPKWKNKVQITACNCSKSGYNRRNWTKHGKLPYITYEKPIEPEEPSTPTENTYKVGDLVKIVSTNGIKYNPNSSTVIPDWVKKETHIVTQVTSNGKEVIKGGKKCVLLGKRLNSSNAQVAGINTWVSVDILTPAPTYQTYTVKAGDSLWAIAKRFLGKGTRYTEIKTLNNLTSNAIYVGNVLKIPNK